MMQAKHLFVWLTALGLLSACAEKDDCGVADTVQEITQVDSGQTRYYLYLKTSGVSDKASFLVLYDHKPSFDACGRADRDAIGEAYVDADRGAPVRAVFAHDTLDIQYVEQAGDSASLQNIEIVVRND
ncbi:hypothetical protein [Denitromonas iodatirespirans]|uniref:Lipoprotein n=1 Tax=Denitromonas iodatirespirans TaxID=2795389 RepID=A0A944DAK0_DENI1|nr:hypothetical protein [Denitromonas iodatirespirans]MBT0962810.1 hypothetical protein [Denitromonas iodatirespirans]